MACQVYGVGGDMNFRKWAFLAAQVFLAWLIFYATRLNSEFGAEIAGWALLIFFGLFLIPQERMTSDNIQKLLKIWKGKEDDA